MRLSTKPPLPMSATTPTPVLELTGIHKQFSGITVLRDIDREVEVRGLADDTAGIGGLLAVGGRELRFFGGAGATQREGEQRQGV